MYNVKKRCIGCGASFFICESEVNQMAKGKYHEWLEPDGLLLIEGWARDGLTNEQIAYNMGISRETLNQWCNKYPDIADTLKRSKEVVDRQVENALFKNAMDGNITAQIFWLKNRKPKEWRDKRDVQVEGEVNNPFKGLTTEELKKMVGEQ